MLPAKIYLLKRTRLLLDLTKILQDNKSPTAWKDLEPTVEKAFKSAPKDINSMRCREGSTLAKDLNERIDALGEISIEVEKHSNNTPKQHRDALLERLRQMDLEINLEDERLLKELAIHADKSDISEEITRLNSHLDQFKEFIKSKESCGRKWIFSVRKYTENSILQAANPRRSKSREL